MKALAIIALVISGTTIAGSIGWNNRYDYEAAIGWGVILAFYTIAFAIVALAKKR
jgi:hypothetical protein